MRIVVESEKKSGAAVRGKITTVDGDLSAEQKFFMNVYAYQGRQLRLSEKESDGAYRIENVQPGEITVYCDPKNPSEMPSAQYDRTPEPGASYISQMHKLEMPEGESELVLDMTLERATHFYGKVIDQNRNPVNEIYVKAMGPDWESYDLSETDVRVSFSWTACTPASFIPSRPPPESPTARWPSSKTSCPRTRTSPSWSRCRNDSNAECNVAPWFIQGVSLIFAINLQAM